MFTTPAPSAPTLSTTTTPASPTSGSRTGRLRGLSYLRTYTQNHLHARSDSEGSNRNHRPSFARARSQPGTSAETGESGRAKPEHSSQRLHNITNWTPSPGTTSGWQPTPGGRGGVSRVSSRQLPGAASTETPSSTTAPTVGITTPASSTGTRSMTRNRADTAAPVLAVRNPPTSSAVGVRDPTSTQHLPSIRFIPHIDPRATRPSLSFPSVSRTLPDEYAVIKVGRYSERETAPDIHPNTPSSAPVGFKSKVVSRRHCEFWCQGHQWYVKDVKSSSGTFLNHLRLSPPGIESKPWPINDGDVIQLGIDFKGGEEAIFRCVKMRIEVNRSWQKAPNNFNKSTHKRLRNLSKAKPTKDSDTASVNSSECSICLMSIAPCQSLFVAPCSHVWHYKCIRPILNGQTWPNFLCPNCRAVADLEADVEEYDDWDESFEIEQAIAASKNDTTAGAGRDTNGPQEPTSADDGHGIQHSADNLPPDMDSPASRHARASRTQQTNADSDALSLSHASDRDSSDDAGGLAQTTSGLSLNDHDPQHQDVQSSSSLSTPRPIPPRPGTSRSTSSPEITQYALTPGTALHTEGPMTPRNDAGPFVLDGGAGQAQRGARGSTSR